MNTTENNKLIAEFMGREIHTDGIGWFDENFKTFTYHKDWNELMKVFKKCGSIGGGYEFDTVERDCFEEIFNPDYAYFEMMDNDIESTYRRIVEFIKWYNSKT